MTLKLYRQFTMSVRLSLVLFCVLACLPTKAQNQTAPRRISIGVITSYFGRRPKLQSYAERLVDHIVSATSTEQDVLLIPFEMTPGQSVRVTKETVTSSFPKTHFEGGGDGYDNEGAMRHLDNLGNPWILISNGPSVSSGKRLIGTPKDNMFAKVLQVSDGEGTLYVYVSELSLEKMCNLVPLQKSSNSNAIKQNQSVSGARSIADNTMQVTLYVLISSVALTCAIAILQYRHVSKKFTEMSEQIVGLVTSSGELMSEVASLQATLQQLVENEILQKDVVADNDIFVRQRLDILLDLTRTSQSQNVELHESKMLKIDEVMDSFTEQQSQALDTLEYLRLISTREGTVATVQSDSRLDEVVALLATLTRDSNEVTNLRQALAEQVADVKKLDESILSFASLIFRISSQTEPSDLDQDTARYILGRLVRYFERVGINIIVPCVGDAFIDEIHAIHASVPATTNAEHMSILDVHEIGLRRGSNVLRTASVTIAIESRS